MSGLRASTAPAGAAVPPPTAPVGAPPALLPPHSVAACCAAARRRLRHAMTPAKPSRATATTAPTAAPACAAGAADGGAPSGSGGAHSSYTNGSWPPSAPLSPSVTLPPPSLPSPRPHANEWLAAKTGRLQPRSKYTSHPVPAHEALANTRA